MRPERRKLAATWPKDRAASASKGNGSKSASACCRTACRAARSLAPEATSGPTDSSARVMQVVSGSWGAAPRRRARAGQSPCSYPARPQHVRSQVRIQNRVEVTPEALRVNVWKLSPAREERFGGEGVPSHGSKVGYRPACACDSKPFAGSHAVDHVTTVVAQVTDRYFAHVSHRLTEVPCCCRDRAVPCERTPDDDKPGRTAAEAAFTGVRGGT